MRGLNDPVAATPFLPEFMADYNRRFAKAPAVAYDAHRPLRPEDDRDALFTLQETRRITRQLTVHYKRDLYVIDDSVATPPAARRGGHRQRGGGRYRDHSRQWRGAPRPPLPEGSRPPRSRRRRRPRAPRRRLRLDRCPTAGTRRTPTRQPQAYPTREAAHPGGLGPTNPGRTTKLAKADISTWGGSGHFYFALTCVVRIHKTLRCTPAMEAGIADRLWTCADIAALLERAEADKSVAA